MNTAVLGEVAEAELELPPALDELAPPEELPLGTCIQGKYVINGVLGHGGFAVVYDAEHLGLARPVAIKVLHLRVETPLALIERFHREARISALVRHANVLQVYDTGTLPDGSPFLVMERIEGETLSAAIGRAPLPIALVVELGCQLLRAIDVITEAGIVHRDIKPDNIMLHLPSDGAPLVKLVDFGIAKQFAIEPASRLTCHGALVGTPQYMSPEQIRGEDVDVRSDLYALGAVLYEALTGRAPHESTNFSELVVAVLNNPILRPSELRENCPYELEEVILRALSRKRDERYSSPREMLEELDAAAAELALPRGEEAFYTPDPLELATRPRNVAARNTLVRRLLPNNQRAARSLKLSAAAALMLMGASGAFQRFGGEAADTGGALSSAAATLPEAHSAAQPERARDMRPVTVPLFDKGGSEPRRGGADDDHGAALTAADSSAAPEVREHGGVESSASALPRGDLRAAGEAAAAAAPRDVDPTARAATTGNAASSAARSEATLAHSSARRESASFALPDGSTRLKWEHTMQAALAELVRGRLSEAQARYREAVKLDPTEPTAFRGLGLVSARIGDVKSAREALQRYLELAPRAADAAAIRTRLASLR